MRDFMLKHADEIWKEKKLKDLFTKAAELKDVTLSDTKSFKNFIETNREGWFDVIFKQEL